LDDYVFIFSGYFYRAYSSPLLLDMSYRTYINIALATAGMY